MRHGRCYLIHRECGEIRRRIPTRFVAEQDAVFGDVVERAGRERPLVSEDENDWLSGGDGLGEPHRELWGAEAAAAKEFERGTRPGNRFDLEMGIELEFHVFALLFGAERDSGLCAQEAAFGLEGNFNLVALSLNLAGRLRKSGAGAWRSPPSLRGSDRGKGKKQPKENRRLTAA